VLYYTYTNTKGEVMYYILAFIAGTIVMDFAWAWKLGIVQNLYKRLTNGKTDSII